jgi:hypothetical protein
MPLIAEFDGIRVWMYYRDHPPPHIHVQHGEHRAQIEIVGLATIAGGLPPPVLRKILDGRANTKPNSP